MLIRLFGTLLLFCLVLGRSERHKRASACYGPLGCFSTNGFFSIRRPINLLPASRQSVNTQFRLYTRKNKDVDHVIRVDYPVTYDLSHFNPNKSTKFIVHGFTDNGFKPWVIKMKNEFLKYADLNVFAVDWGSGSRPPYAQATANTRLVGAEIAYMIKFLQKKGLKPEDVHVIGHSLGSHTAGYAGSATKNLGRITGLDPAGPYFEHTSSRIQLDPSDAKFVDNIHTDARSILRLGFGMMQPSGHVDYYPNSGRHQPGCDKDPFSFVKINGIEGGLTKFVACDHMRSVHYFTESINSRCKFTSFQCESYEYFKDGQCSLEPTAQMGLHSDQYITHRQKRIKMYLETSDKEPFCEFLYEIQVDIGSQSIDAKSERGKIFIQIIGDRKETEMTEVTRGNTDLHPHSTLSFVMKSKTLITNVSSVKFKWEQDKKWYKPWTWGILGLVKNDLYVNKIKIVNNDAKEFVFCGFGSTKIKTETVKPFTPNMFCT